MIQDADIDAIWEDLLELAGALAQSKLLIAGFTRVEPLTGDHSEAVFRSSWHEAVQQYFPNAEPYALRAVVEELLEAMIAGELGRGPSRPILLH